MNQRLQVGIVLISCVAGSALAFQDSAVAPTDDSTSPFAIENMVADIDDTVRFVPSTRPTNPQPQNPPLSTDKNTDTGRPIPAWQRLTDDWGGTRAKLDDRGVSFGISVTADMVKNLRGGANTADMDLIHLTSINATLDTDRLFGFAGGTVFINYQHVGGDNPSDNVGDWQWVSNLGADGRRDQISELWYEQKIGETFRVKLGKIDANSEFAVSDNSGEFLNASAGMTPVVPGFAAYPDQAGGVVIDYAASDNLYIRLGLFDGSVAEGKTPGDDNIASFYGGPGDLLYIAELGTTWSASAGRSGRLAVGAAFHDGDWDRFAGGSKHGVAGYYFVLDQILFKEEPDNDQDQQATYAYLRGGIGDEDTQDVHLALSGGVAHTGLFETRDDDSTGIGFHWISFSDESDLNDDELTFEVFHKFQITRFFSIKPDIQYVHSPGGIREHDDAIVAAIRLALEF